MNIVRNLDLTIISAIHDLSIAAMYCDEIYVLQKGKVIAVGSPEIVLTEKLIKDIYEVDARVIKDENGALHILYQAG